MTINIFCYDCNKFFQAQKLSDCLKCGSDNVMPEDDFPDDEKVYQAVDSEFYLPTEN